MAHSHNHNTQDAEAGEKPKLNVKKKGLKIRGFQLWVFDQTHKGQPVSASQVLELKVCTTIRNNHCLFLFLN